MRLGDAHLLGGLLAILSAASFGLNDATVRRGVLTGTSLQGLSISVPLGVPLFAIGALFAGTFGLLFEFSSNTVILLATAGIAHFVWGRYWNYRAIRAIGNNLAGPVQQTTLIVSLGGAAWFLGEVFTPLRLGGIALVFLGSAVMLRSLKAKRATLANTGAVPTEAPAAPEPTFQPQYLVGFSSAILSVLGFGSSSVLIRAALEGTNPGAGLAGGIIAYLAATVIVAIVLMRPGQFQHVLSMDRGAARWFTLSGFLVWLAQMFRFMALSIAPVSVVAPLMQTMVIFRVMFGWFINRKYEDFGIWVLLGIFVSLLGAFALTVSVEFVISHLPLPETIVEIARWQWP